MEHLRTKPGARTTIAPFLFLSATWSGHRRRPFHCSISFSSLGFVLRESNAANQRHDNIFHQLGDPGQEPSRFGKNQGWLFILSPRTCGPAFKVHKPVPININYSQTTQRLKRSRLKSVYSFLNVLFLWRCAQSFSLHQPRPSARLSFSLE